MISPLSHEDKSIGSAPRGICMKKPTKKGRRPG